MSRTTGRAPAGAQGAAFGEPGQFVVGAASGCRSIEWTGRRPVKTATRRSGEEVGGAGLGDGAAGGPGRARAGLLWPRRVSDTVGAYPRGPPAPGPRRGVGWSCEGPGCCGRASAARVRRGGGAGGAGRAAAAGRRTGGAAAGGAGWRAAGRRESRRAGGRVPGWCCALVMTLFMGPRSWAREYRAVTSRWGSCTGRGPWRQGSDGPRPGGPECSPIRVIGGGGSP